MALPPQPVRNARFTKSDVPPPLVAPAREEATPRFRLRGVLALLLIGCAGWGLYPRGKAAWRLHTEATVLADYALCMAGPTGPSLLRDNPPAFKQLVRRRVIYASADERPFERCAAAARDLMGSAAIEAPHRATAWSFAEYGSPAERGGVSIDQLAVTTRPLIELARDGWPFVRDGWTQLVKPSLGAFEATHPVELPRPAVGRGLPAWRARYRALHVAKDGLVLAVGHGANLAVFRSTDGGTSWSPASPRQSGVSYFAERCAAVDGVRSFVFGTSDDARRTTVTSLGPDASPQTADLAPADANVIAAACDDGALVAAIAEGRSVTLSVCPFRQACRPLALPVFPGVKAPVLYPLDVARVDGATIVSVAMRGIVRVASTRDDGRTWTPFTVAFDAALRAEARTRVRVPDRLLALGKRVLLYAGSDRPTDTYPVLLSDDLGAAWRTP